MYQTVLVTKNNNIATITFNRPAVMNCFDKQMGDELEAVTENIRLDKSIRAVLLNGAGSLFMAGGDILFFNERLSQMPEGIMQIIHRLNASIINLMRMPKPVIASVHGSVAGVGISFMLACDLVIASETTKFSMAYSGIGISPDGGISFNLPRIVGPKKAMEWMLLSELFDAKTALAHGLVNWIVSEEQREAETQRILQRLVNGPTTSYAHIKKLVNYSWQNGLESQLEQEALSFEACSMSSDFQSGVKAFLNKKRPEFAGV